ncbi:MAG: transglutaminaseTgpA domain-containing protein [Planctomycetia bacterium]|nr:transglutaminaseTgpA domain-containing protein [Planctomycetia bacterium]
MDFTISCVLAIVTVLATFMLQLCDDHLKSNASAIIGVATFITIASALYWVDYKKKFTLSKRICNILIVLVVVLQLKPLLSSRDEFLAFSIANILASLQAILFLQRKTLRTSYQILSISFIEVAVGAVFQRSSLFVLTLPLYAILAFTCISLLFIWGERKFYSERITLKNRFIGNRTLKMITVEEPAVETPIEAFDAFNNEAALSFAHHAHKDDQLRFFRKPSTLPVQFDLPYFRRFALGSFYVFLFASIVFWFFPRLDEFGFGELRFSEINWGRSSAGLTQTGFRDQIELGDLGPAIDSHATVMSVRFVNMTQPEVPPSLNIHSPIYFRGSALTQYNDRKWIVLNDKTPKLDVNQLRYALANRTVADPDYILSSLLENSSETQSPPTNQPSDSRYPQNNNMPQRQLRSVFQWNFNPAPSLSQGSSSTSNQNGWPPSYRRVTHEPTLGFAPQTLSVAYLYDGFESFNSLTEVAQQLLRDNVDISTIKYDARGELIGIDSDQKALDVATVFMISPYYLIKSDQQLQRTESFGTRINFANRRDFHQPPRTNVHSWSVSTAFQRGEMARLTPNQELVWPYIDQYLEIDQDFFPQLCQLAQQWDEESQIPQENFIARALYFENKLRNTGMFQYNRSGVERDPFVDPLEDFVSVHRAGHCEYFAGALVMLLRAVGIPARVVVGFVTYPTDDGKPVTVRQSDAHAWVEAYIPTDKLPKKDSPFSHLFAGSSTDSNGNSCLPDNVKEWPTDGAWLRLDATPSSDRDAERPSTLALGIFTWSNFFKSFGHDYVLNFNGAQQMRSVYEPILRLLRKLLHLLRSLAHNLSFLKIILDQFYQAFDDVLHGNLTPVSLMRIVLIVSLVVATPYLSIKLFLRARRKVKTLLLEKKQQEILAAQLRNNEALQLNLRLEEALGRIFKTTRSPWETSREFITRCIHINEDRVQLIQQTIQSQPTSESEIDSLSPSAIKLITNFVERYYRSQFGMVPMTLKEKQAWNDQFQSLGLFTANS